jgi:NAD(P)-dependent dehydrogenase (short-subunit alcohol dehydrogenase family)
MPYEPMDFDRLNPVVLVTGAASGLGAACAHDLAPSASGGLVLVDAEAGALDAAADALEGAPERVSTLAFDVADQARWTQAAEFIGAQYGRLDFAVINVGDGAAVLTDKRLQNRKRGPTADMDAAFLSIRALTRLLGANAQGGAIVLTTTCETLTDSASQGLLPLLRVAAKEGDAAGVRVNAIALGKSDAAAARRAPCFREMSREAGAEAAALEKVARLPAPVARYDGDDVVRLVNLLLRAQKSGAALVVDAADAL